MAFKRRRKGSYNINLIDATTKTPFKEHKGKNGFGKYFEVEPNTEYFIRMTHHAKGSITVRYKVDGKDLGYFMDFNKEDMNKPKLIGIWSFTDKQSQNKALKFKKLDRISMRNNNSETTSFALYSLSYIHQLELYLAVHIHLEIISGVTNCSYSY